MKRYVLWVNRYILLSGENIFKVSNETTGLMWLMCSKLTIKTPENTPDRIHRHQSIFFSK